MKPQTIRALGMGHPETRRIVRWLEANGLRHYVPEDARIIVTGNRIIVPTFDIERVGQKGTAWARSLWDTDRHGDGALPTKTRTYRIRHELKDIR